MPTSITAVETRMSASPSRKRRITSSFCLPDMRPCSSSSRRSGKTCVRSRSYSAVAAFTSSVSDSSTSGQMTNAWRPFSTCAAHEALGVVALVRADPRRLDRLAAGRHLVDDGDVEVAVQRQRERARDRRRRHHEHVRRVRGLRALLAQGGALHDAEAVLLVDDGDAEVVEAHAALDQRVRAAGDVDLAGLDRLVQLALLLRLQAAGEQRDADLGRALRCEQQRRLRRIEERRRDVRGRRAVRRRRAA